MHISAKHLEHQLEGVRALEDRLTFRLSILSKLLDQEAIGLLEGTGLSLTAYRILNVTTTFGDVSISDISRFCAIDRGQVSRTAVQLEKQHLVEFLSDPDSKRKKLVRISDSGRTLLEAVKPRFLERNSKLDTLLGPERREQLIEMINILTEQVAQ